MAEHVLHREQWIPASLDDVFEFFSDARNLEAITPTWMNFRITTPGPIEMRPGAEIRYRLRMFGVPIRWKTIIDRWEPGKAFVDRQERGPYALWHHTHTFEPLGEGVLMSDRVRYRLPLGPLGELAHVIWVRGALAEIFDYRFARIREEFGSAPTTEALLRIGLE